MEILYKTFPRGDRRTQRYFNVSSPSSRKDKKFPNLIKLTETKLFFKKLDNATKGNHQSISTLFNITKLSESIPFSAKLFHRKKFLKVNHGFKEEL